MKKTFDKNFLSTAWRISNLYKIVDKNSQLIQFRPNPIQQIINRSTAQKKMILKPRQIGSTTGEVIKLLDATIYQRNTTTCIMAHEADAIKKIFRIARKAYRHMEPSLKPDLDRGGGSKYEMTFPEINSLIYCDLESRGDTISRLHISEAAFVAYDRFISTMQAVPISGRVTIESTANGVGNWFYDMWQENDDYEKLFFPWFMDTGYRIVSPEKLALTSDEKNLIAYAKKTYGVNLTEDQIRFRRFKQRELKDFFFQEYPEDAATCFILSGGAVISRTLIQELIQRRKKALIKKNGLEIFSKRIQNGNYVIGADPAQGIGKDSSVGVCYHVDTMEEVAILRGQFPPSLFAKRLAIMADIFSTGMKVPLMAVEQNNHGHAVLLELSEHIKYPRLYEHKEDRPGWLTNLVTRPIMVDQLIDALEHDTIKVNSLETLNECLTMVDLKGKIQATPGKHDDCFMATAIALQMLKKESSNIQLYDNVSSSIMV